ncbi:TRAP transporter solute receptor, TAXI family [Leptolyngbya sp. NIES-3755]|nr:TRAP transporter solute receptor, TAXI family [Leptolyngbya sp. NIES-3755]
MNSQLSLPSKILLALCFVFAVVSVNWVAISSQRITHLNLDCGEPQGESFILGNAIAKVIHENNPRLDVSVIATSGSDENFEQLEKGAADLAIVQADLPGGRAARTVAVLFEDMFQLIVQSKSGLNNLNDLVGHKIVLQPNSGEFYSFLELAEHYGLKLEDFQLTFATGAEAEDLFRQKQVDAMFRVRTLNNDYITHMVQQTRAQILPIEQAKALQVRHPALEPALIPMGVYQGYPAIPPVDLPSISLKRLLVASQTIDAGVVKQITQIILEHQREIANAIPESYADLRPLVAGIKRPSASEGTGIALHPGAIAYYERDRPTLVSILVSFLIKNGGLLIALTTLPAGSLVGLWEWWQRLKQQADDRKLLADRYINSAIASIEIPGELEDVDRQSYIRSQQKTLEQLLVEAATALAQDQITQQSFRVFNEAYNTARLVLQRCAENSSEDLCDRYIQTLISFQEPSQSDLSALLQQVETSLIKKEITQEGFRTFMDAYRATARSLKTQRQEQAKSSPSTE